MAYDTIATQLASAIGISPWIVILVTIWAIAWKGWALWVSARKNSPIWFVILLIINTLGILEILYIFIFSKMGEKKAKSRRR
jgi:methionyl-tRNA synthetase